MLNELTDKIRASYLKLEISKNEKLNVEIKLGEVERSITTQELEIKKLEADREFYTLVSMYERYKDYDFPQEIKQIAIERDVYFNISPGCCVGFKISEFTFGELLELWNKTWNYNGNPIVYSQYHNGGGYIEYWDLETCTIKSVRKVFKLDITKYERQIRNKNLGGINDVINFIKKNIL